ncbi:MAG: DNA mismatch repair protein MutL [Lentimonas sp.]
MQYSLMPSIRILSDRVANQIAAGEVIERPVAVVKELVENSIDAGATRVEVEFRNGGKSYMRIEDNGKGMSPDEALLSLERHATSKIREAADLNEILSFGFRGEALPSIASVSKFTLRTRAAGWEHGSEILINGGKLISRKDCGMPVGTVIEVAHLFNSVPARRKFLKTDPTETAHITYNTRLFAVANPQVAFRVLENGRSIFQSPACAQLRDRIGEIWGHSLADDLIPVDATDPNHGYRLTGLTAKPGVGRSTRRELVTLVNRRPVDSRTLGFAVMDAYHGRIQKGRYPPAFLFLEMLPRDVDVNVHPAKREVRFRDEGSVRRFVLSAISETLAKYQVQDLPLQQQPAVELNSPTATAPTAPTTSPTASVAPSPIPVAAPVQPIPPQKSQPSFPAPIASRREAPRSAQPIASPNPAISSPAAATKNTTPPASPNQPEAIAQWRWITCLKKRYALYETPRGLVMLHLRQADQRIRFERICKDFQQHTIPSQRLLVPHPIELDPIAAENLKNQLDLLNSQGFEVEEFGRHFYRISAVPHWLSETQAETFIRDLLDLIRQRGELRNKAELTWQAIAKLAVQGSYQSNDTVSETSMQQLASDLFACETPHTSPYGKPTFSEVSWNEWARRFGDN